MNSRESNPGVPVDADTAPGPPVVRDRAEFQAAVDRLRTREKAHTRQGDAIAAARRRLPMVEVDADIELIGPRGAVTLLDAFEGRRQLIAYYFMWYDGQPAPGQCQGCTWCTTQVGELSYLHSRDITFAVLCQGPYDESRRYHDFMGWTMPWYSAQASLGALLDGRETGTMYLICYLRDGDRVFETYWTNMRGVEVMDNNYALMDLTAYGRQEPWEDSPPGWPQRWGCDDRDAWRINGRPIAQWSRLEAGRRAVTRRQPWPPEPLRRNRNELSRPPVSVDRHAGLADARARRARPAAHDPGGPGHFGPRELVLYYILALTPFAVWLVVAIVRSSRRPFADFLVLGVLYGLSLMVVHQVLWDVGPRWAQPAPSGRTRGAIAEPVERHRWSVRRGDRQRRYQAPPPPTRPPRDAARSGVASARAR